MKVFELIEKLQKCDPNAIVEFECDDDWYSGEIQVVRKAEYNNGTKVAVLSLE